MPTVPPRKTPAKTKAKTANPTFDALGIWSLSLGFSAVAMAAIALVNVVLIGALWWLCRARDDVPA